MFREQDCASRRSAGYLILCIYLFILRLVDVFTLEALFPLFVCRPLLDIVNYAVT